MAFGLSVIHHNHVVQHPILEVSPVPVWIPRDLFFRTLHWIDEHPSAWLTLSPTKYIHTVFDSRTGNGRMYYKEINSEEQIHLAIRHGARWDAR